MRKLLLTTAAVAAAMAGTVASETAFGTFTDTRDGQTYKTVKIGKQTWMAQNLNYTADSSWCYGESNPNNFWHYYKDDFFCDEYGRLYNWYTAITVCPAGYHLPSRVEWDNLGKSVGGKRKASKTNDSMFLYENAAKKLKSRNGWNSGIYSVHGNGMDDFGFSALPSGYRNHYVGKFFDIGDDAYWWTATDEGSIDFAYPRGMWCYTDDMIEDYELFIYNKTNGFSVRCVADNP